MSLLNRRVNHNVEGPQGIQSRIGSGEPGRRPVHLVGLVGCRATGDVRLPVDRDH